MGDWPGKINEFQWQVEWDYDRLILCHNTFDTSSDVGVSTIFGDWAAIPLFDQICLTHLILRLKYDMEYSKDLPNTRPIDRLL